MSWTKCYFSAQNIEVDTGRAILIRFPKKSKYGGYKFWHPSSLVRNEGGKGYFMSFSFSEDFTFNIFKNGNGRYNSREKISEMEVSYEDIMECFENDGLEQSISAQNETYVHVKEPEKIEVEEIEVKEELVNE